MSARERIRAAARRRLPEPVLELWRDLRGGMPEPWRTTWPNSLVTPLNLLFLEELCWRVARLDVPGDFVECGVYRGGSAGVLGHTLVALPGEARKLWLYDSFEGMPEAGPHDDAFSHSIVGDYVGSERHARRMLRRLGVPQDRFEILRGRFERTLHERGPDTVALLHVDCDFYDPVKLALETFYPRVRPGGYVVLNDYGSFQGCRSAADEFIERTGFPVAPVFIDRAAAFFQKPGDGYDGHPVAG